MRKLIIVICMLAFGFSVVSCRDATETIESTVTTETTTERPSISCTYTIPLEVSNGIDQIQTHFIMSSAHGTDPDNQFWADGIYWKLSDAIDGSIVVPSIEQVETMDLLKGRSTSVSTIEVYDFDEVLVDTWDSWDERSTLDTGQYLIIIHISNTQSNCIVSGVSLFILNAN